MPSHLLAHEVEFDVCELVLLQEYSDFWPARDDTSEYSNFTLTYINESQQGSHVCRDFLIQSTQVGTLCMSFTQLFATLAGYHTFIKGDV